MSAPPVIVIGAGGHAIVVCDALRLNGRRILGATDSDPLKRQGPLDGICLLGGDDAVLRHAVGDVVLANGVAQVRGGNVRRRIFERFAAAGYRFDAVVHPSAVLAADSVYGDGMQAMAGAVIQPRAHIGRNVLINTRGSVDHECRIGDHCHIAPGAVLCGAVSVGDGTHIGAGAVIREGIRIGSGVTVAAGSVVIADVPDGARVCGVPAREMAI